MRAVVQRVREAKVIVADETVGAIGRGFLVLLGITTTDTDQDADWLAEKIGGLRLFPDDSGKMNRDLTEIGGAMLVVSQFTLYGDARKGRRPSFVLAAPPAVAEPLYNRFIRAVKLLGIPVATGVFGAEMQVSLINDGPVTLLLERGQAAEAV
jgi:D-tyrosyl-tRNA(Tyr) deacylase